MCFESLKSEHKYLGWSFASLLGTEKAKYYVKDALKEN